MVLQKYGSVAWVSRGEPRLRRTDSHSAPVVLAVVAGPRSGGMLGSIDSAVYDSAASISSARWMVG